MVFRTHYRFGWALGGGNRNRKKKKNNIEEEKPQMALPSIVLTARWTPLLSSPPTILNPVDPKSIVCASDSLKTSEPYGNSIYRKIVDRMDADEFIEFIEVNVAQTPIRCFLASAKIINEFHSTINIQHFFSHRQLRARNNKNRYSKKMVTF